MPLISKKLIIHPIYCKVPVLLMAFLWAGQIMGQCSADAGSASSLCVGATTTLGGSPAATGTPPFTYTWTPATGLSATDVANPVLTMPGTTQTYTLTITDADGCTANDQVTITALPTPVIQLTSNDPDPDLYIAPGGTSFALCGTGLPDYDFQFTDISTAQAGASYTFSWGNPPENFTPTATGWTESHNYPIGLHTMQYSITNPNGCSTSAEIDVFLGSNPSVGTSNPGNTVVCSGTELVFPINNTDNNSPGTIYEVSYGDGNGDTFTHPPPASVGYTYPATNCPGAPYTFQIDAITPCPITSFATAGPIYITDTPQASFTISPNDTACVNSVVTFTNTSLGVGGFNCNAPQRVWSITPATGYAPPAGMGNTNGSTQPSQWSNGNNAINVQFTEPGTYCVQLIVGNNLCGTDTVEHCVCIEAPPAPQFTLQPTTGCAPLTSTTVNQSVSPNSCATSFLWDVEEGIGSCGGGPEWNYAGGSSAGSFEPQFQFTQAGNYTVELSATNSCGTFTDSENITIAAPPVVDLQPVSSICAGDAVQPVAVYEDCGAAIDSYAWTMPNGDPVSAVTPQPGSVSYAAPGNNTITIAATNACGTTTQQTTVVVSPVPPAPNASSNTPVCLGQTISLNAIPIPGATFNWTGPNGFSANQASVTIPNATAANAGTYTVVAVVNGCAGPPSTITVAVLSAPVLTVINSDPVICAGESSTLTVSGAGGYEWYIGNTFMGVGETQVVSPNSTTTYTVSGSVGGCPGSTTTTVVVNQLPNVNAGPDVVFCDQAITEQLSGSPQPGTWTGPIVTADGSFTPVPGEWDTYTLTYTHTDANGCTSSDQVEVTVEELTLIAALGPDTTVCQSPIPVQLSASPPGGTWNGAAQNGTFIPDVAGTFNISYDHGSGSCATSDAMQVTVQAAPQLTLPDDIDLCIDAAVVPLVALPDGGDWSGAGISGPPWQFDPAVAGAGDHFLSYSFSDGLGCTSTGIVEATIHALPVVDAGEDLLLCDQPVPVSLGGTPAGGSWSATWMDVDPDGTFIPNGIGNDVFTYSFTDVNGCTASETIAVEVIAVDEPALAGDDVSLCVGSAPIQLVGQPGGGDWSGDQVEPDGLFTPAVAGEFILTYAVGSGTCLSMDQITVTVEALPVVSIVGGTGVCLDAGPQQLEAQPPGGTWGGVGVDPISGVFDPLISGEGQHPVTYTFTDDDTGCSAVAQATVGVDPLPTAAFSNAAIACIGAPFPFTNESIGASQYLWDFGDGNTSAATAPQHVYDSTGDFDVMLVAYTAAGCTDTTMGTVTVWSAPMAEANMGPVEGCGPLEVDFDNGSLGNGLSYQWDFGGLGDSEDAVPPPFIFPSDPLDAVNYTVTLTATNLCGIDQDQTVITVLPTPTAILGTDLDVYCAYDTAWMINGSIGLPETFFWDFGDGNTSTAPGPVVGHPYATGEDPESFTVTLVAANACGSDTATYTIDVLPNEVTAFFNTAPTSGCAPLTVEFTQFAVGDTAWAWDLGDGNVSQELDPTHTFVDAGTYTVTLSAYGCGYDEATVEIEVFPSPEPEFTFAPETACANEPITFTDLSTGISAREWDFGDGNGSQLVSPEHTYAEGGTYQVTLTVTGSLNGCVSSVTQEVTVLSTPVAAFVPQPASGCMPLPVVFINESGDSDFHQWAFGDGNSSGLFEPMHTYAEAGTYTVTLVAEHLSGCTDTTSAVVVVHPLPVSAFSLEPDQSCDSPVDVQTSNASTGAVSYTWDLGNGEITAINQPLITFDGPGTYTVQLVATNQYGCTDTSSVPFTVHPTPIAQFVVEPDPACATYPVVFTNQSQHAQQFLWDLGDGLTSATSDPVHVYDTPGTYDVVLVAIGAGGCTDTLVVEDALVVHPTPIADFITDTLPNIDNALRFINLSQGATQYTWNFGDGATSTQPNPVHLFPGDADQHFEVCLVAVNDLGCPDTTCAPIWVASDPLLFAPNAFTPNGDGLNEVFVPVLNGFGAPEWAYRFMVFDRWGLLLHDTTEPGHGWDGRLGGQDAPVDVYVWRVVLERWAGGERVVRRFTGHVTLVR